MGTLRIVATPIGNLEDITLRAIKTLFEVDVIACEDTRRTGLLLLKIQDMYSRLIHYTNGDLPEHPRLLSYYEENEMQRIPEIVSLIKDGKDVALISDAGTPAISDPGFKLIRECLQQGIKVESVPGPSSVISALVSSGLPTDTFLFIGYPPRKPGNRMKRFESLKKSLEDLNSTVILFEAPHRLPKTLTDLEIVFGDIEIVIAKELTKVHESVKKEKIDVLISHYKKHTAKGEYVILFNLKSVENS